jgi:2-dehydropantoate 2-reductase
MNVIVVGAGAMGSIFGAALVEGGSHPTFLDVHQDTVDVLRRDGLTIERRDGTTDHYRIPVTTDPSGMSQTDLVLLLVKGYSTRSALELVRPAVGSETILLTLQNGLGNEEVIRTAFPSNPVLIGNTLHSVAVLAPGHVRHTGVRGTKIGPSADVWAPQAELAARAMASESFSVEALSQSQIRRQIWTKFTMNCGSLATCALTRLPTPEVAANEDVLALVDQLVRETCRIAAAAGIPLDPDSCVAFSRELFRTAGGKASMLQDIERGRPTEIDTINGAAVDYAERFGVSAPLNRAMVALIKGCEISLGIGR